MSDHVGKEGGAPFRYVGSLCLAMDTTPGAYINPVLSHHHPSHDLYQDRTLLIVFLASLHLEGECLPWLVGLGRNPQRGPVHPSIPSCFKFSRGARVWAALQSPSCLWQNAKSHSGVQSYELPSLSKISLIGIKVIFGSPIFLGSTLFFYWCGTQARKDTIYRTPSKPLRR